MLKYGVQMIINKEYHIFGGALRSKRRTDKNPNEDRSGFGGASRAPVERPDKIPNGDQGEFRAWFANRVSGWGWPPRPKPAQLPFLYEKNMHEFEVQSL